MKAYLSYNIHDLIKVKSNVSIPPSFVPSFFLKKHLQSVDIEVRRDSKLEVPISSLTPLGLRLFYNNDVFVHKCHFFLDTHLEIKETKNKTVIKFNRMYELVRNPLDYFFAFLQMKLLDKNFAFMHAACVTKNGESLLFPAFSDTGKTTTALLFLRDGYKLLGDDKIITDGQKVFSYPAPIRKILWRPFETIPFLRRFAMKKMINPPITLEAIPKRLFFLIIGKKNEVEEVDREDISEKVSIMTEATCPLFPHPMGVMLGYYFIRDIRFKTHIEKRKTIISQLVNNCKTFTVTANRSSKFYELIKQVVSN